MGPEGETAPVYKNVPGAWRGEVTLLCGGCVVSECVPYLGFAQHRVASRGGG